MVMFKVVRVKPFLLFKINKGQNNSFWREPTDTFTDSDEKERKKSNQIQSKAVNGVLPA